MDLVLRGLTWSHVIEYVDDAIVYSKSFDQHLSHLAEVFQRTGDVNLKLKPEKCRLFASSVKFLSHIVSFAGTAVNPEKTAVIDTWPVPTNVSKNRIFIGICSYYRRYVEDIKTATEPVGQQARWVDLFEQFKCQLMLWKGVSHGNVDFLSRRPCGPECRQCLQHQLFVRVLTTRRLSGISTPESGRMARPPSWKARGGNL